MMLGHPELVPTQILCKHGGFQAVPIEFLHRPCVLRESADTNRQAYLHAGVSSPSSPSLAAVTMHAGGCGRAPSRLRPCSMWPFLCVRLRDSLQVHGRVGTVHDARTFPHEAIPHGMHHDLWPVVAQIGSLLSLFHGCTMPCRHSSPHLGLSRPSQEPMTPLSARFKLSCSMALMAPSQTSRF